MTFTMMSRSASAPVLPGQTHHERETLCITSPTFRTRGSLTQNSGVLAGPRHTQFPGNGTTSCLHDRSSRPSVLKVNATLSFHIPPPEKRGQQNVMPEAPLRRIHSENELGPESRHSKLNRIMSSENLSRRHQGPTPMPNPSSDCTDTNSSWTYQLLPASLLGGGVQSFFTSTPARGGSPLFSLEATLTGTPVERSSAEGTPKRQPQELGEDSPDTAHMGEESVEGTWLWPMPAEHGMAFPLDMEVMYPLPRALQSVYQPVLRPHPEVLEAVGDEFLIEGPAFYREGVEDQRPSRISLSQSGLDLPYSGAEVTGEYYSRALEGDPESPLLLRNYARFLVQTGGDYELAEQCLERAIVASPCDADVLVQYAKLVWDYRRDADRAVSYFERAVHASPEDCYVLAAYASFLWSVEASGAATPSSEGSHGGPHCPSSMSPTPA